MLELLLSLALTAPPQYYHKPKQPKATYRKAVQKRQVDGVVRYLRRQDPAVIQQVMRRMGWMIRTEPRDASRKKKKSDLEKINDWEMRMLCEMAGLPCYKKR